MKYLIIHEVREPYEENAKKMLEVEKKRNEKGEAFTDEERITAIYFPMSLPSRGYRIVDCEPEKMMKWVMAYQGIFNAEIIPVGSREDWQRI